MTRIFIARRFLGFASLILLPLDIAEVTPTTALFETTLTKLPALQVISEGTDSDELLHAWRLLYWITWFMAWVLLPTVSEWWAAGDFTWQARFWTAIRLNMRG